MSSTRQSSVTPSVASSSSYDSSVRGNTKQLYCVCRKPDQGSWMINCEVCNDWFHGTCVSLDETDEPLIGTYVCPICTGQGKGRTTWVRKCRLDACKRPAIAPAKGSKASKGSKYCSPEHAVLFFTRKLQHLHTDSITPQQLKALVNEVNVDEFKVLGNHEPEILPEILNKYRTMEDESRLADLRLEREKINRKLEIVELRQNFFHLVVEKAKQLNLNLKAALPIVIGKNKGKSKAKEICGYDGRLSLDEAEFLEWSASEEGNRILTERKIEGDSECTVEKRRCRHVGWQSLRDEDILMEESQLRGRLDAISRQEMAITAKQKVRVRNANLIMCR